MFEDDDYVASLLRIAEMTSAPKSTQPNMFNRDIENFIHEIKLEIGQNPVPIKKIYAAYKRIRKDDAMTPHQFTRYFKSFFKPIKTSGFTYFYLNAEVLGLSPVYTVFTDRQYFPLQEVGRDDKYKRQRLRKAERAKKEKEALEAKEANEQKRNKE